MIYKTATVGPEPIPFGAYVKQHAGKLVPATFAEMQGVATRPRWAVHEAAYKSGDKARYLTDGYVLAITPDGSGTQMVTVVKGRVE